MNFATPSKSSRATECQSAAQKKLLQQPAEIDSIALDAVADHRVFDSAIGPAAASP
jgi:hypothetical protein